MGHCDAKTCVLDVLEPVFGDDAGNIAMNYTCFPMNCDVASEQARHLLDRVAAIGKSPALAEVQAEIYRDLEAAMDNPFRDPGDPQKKGPTT